MDSLRQLRSRVVALFRRRDLEAEMAEEMRQHLERRIQEKIAEGVAPDEARHAAQREFGGAEQIKERCRDERGFVWLERVFQDTRVAVRALCRRPGFTVTAVLTLAVGIGANTALFSIFHRLVLSPLDLPEPQRLVRVWANNPGRNFLAPAMSAPAYELFAGQQQSFAGIAASLISGFMLTRDDAEPEQLPALQVTASWQPTTGMPLLRGRNFTAAEDSPGGPRVVILTEACWRARFGARETILGESLTLSGTPHTVIGILRGPLPPPVAFVQLLVPRVLDSAGLTPQQIRSGISFLQVTARLKPGTSFQQADAEVRALARRYQEAFPANLDGSNGGELRTWIEEIVGNVRPTLVVLLTAVALVLLIACANVSNLLLGRLSARHREIAVRLSLGATRGALVRQFLIETALFCAIATGLGVLLATWSLAALEKLLAGQLPTGTHFALDGLTLAFTAGISVLACVAIGLVAALHASRPNLSDALKDAARGAPGGVRGSRFRSGLVVAEVALSVILLVGSGLLLASFLKLQSAPPGFVPRGAATAAINLPGARYRTPAQQTLFLDDALGRLRLHPQVRQAAAASSLPVGFLSGAPRGVYAVQGHPIPPADQRPFAFLVVVSEDYFKTIAVPLAAGRYFTPDDHADAPAVAITNESFAKKLFPDGGALDRVLLRGPQADQPVRIVGIVADVKSQGLNAPAPDTLYLSLRQLPRNFVSLVAKTDGDALALEGVFRSVVSAADRTVVVTLFQTLESALRATIGFQRIVALFTAIFAGLALGLAVLGLYSVLAYTVTQRTHEIGIRMALGATKRQIVSLVLHHGLGLVAIGLVIGLAGAAGASLLIQKLLFDVKPLSPLVYAAVVLLFTMIGAIACLVPARHAAKVDPMTALRTE